MKRLSMAEILGGNRQRLSEGEAAGRGVDRTGRSRLLEQIRDSKAARQGPAGHHGEHRQHE